VLDLPPRLRQQGRRPFSLWRSHPSYLEGKFAGQHIFPQDYSDGVVAHRKPLGIFSTDALRTPPSVN